MSLRGGGVHAIFCAFGSITHKRGGLVAEQNAEDELHNCVSNTGILQAQPHK
jgi:hypothetical protein